MNQDNEALVRRWFAEVWNEKRTEAVDEFLAPDCVSHLESGEFVGPAAFRQYHAGLVEALPDLRLTLDEVIAQGEAVAVRWTVTATHKGMLLGLAPTGQAIQARGMTWVHMRDGKIVEGWDSWNQGGLVQQLNKQ